MVLNRFMPVIKAPFEHAPSCELESVAMAHKGNIFHKWHHYMEIYDRHFKKFKGKPITLLEIGVDCGGSLQLWQSYFGADAKIYGADINKTCEDFRKLGLNIYIGDQSDPVFLQQLIDDIAPFDVVIDDGSHIGTHQILGFETLFPHIKHGGVYICEDLHTTYWPDYSGGLNNTNRFTDYVKNMIDNLHEWYKIDLKSPPTDFVTETVGSIHAYDSMIVIEKTQKTKPKLVGYGTGTSRASSVHPQNI